MLKVMKLLKSVTYCFIRCFLLVVESTPGSRSVRLTYRTAASSAMDAQFVAAAEMNWSAPCGKSLSK